MDQYAIILLYNTLSGGTNLQELERLLGQGGILCGRSGGPPTVLQAGQNGTILVYDDNQITGFRTEAINNRLSKYSNLSDLTDVTAARSNLGLGNAATKDVGTQNNQVAAGDHEHPASVGGLAPRSNAVTIPFSSFRQYYRYDMDNLTGNLSVSADWAHGGYAGCRVSMLLRGCSANYDVSFSSDFEVVEGSFDTHDNVDNLIEMELYAISAISYKVVTKIYQFS